MTINVDHYPNKSFALLSFIPPFTIDLNQSVKGRLSEGEQLTNANALKIFKQIEWKSDVLSFLTKPVVLISLSGATLVAGLCIPATAPALLTARLIVCMLGCAILSYSLDNSYSGFLPKLSQAYYEQSKRAREYIRNLEAFH